MTYNQFKHDLAARLQQPLPGIAKDSAFAPELCYGRHQGPAAHDARLAAVLVLLYRDGEDWRVPLTVRPTTLPTHAGQVSFPGGEAEVGERARDTALREYEEELGVAADDIELIGKLSQVYVYASNFLVMPWVAMTPRRPPFDPNPAEVANLLEPSVVELQDRNRYGSHAIRRYGIQFDAPHIEHAGHTIWGATRMMLAELLNVLPPPATDTTPHTRITSPT